MNLFRSTSTASLAIAASLLVGCSGGIHTAGTHQVGVSGSFGHAIKGEAIWPDGEGRADSAGVTIDYRYFTADRFAIGAAATPYRNYNQSDGDVTTGEFQLSLRYYFWETDALGVPIGFFAEALGGIMTGSASVPQEGSATNFTQDTGLGVEMKLTENISWVTGYHLRHLSNGRIFRSDSNPAQNDHYVFTGIAISWK